MTYRHYPAFQRMFSELFDDLVAVHGREAVEAAYGPIDDDGEPDDLDSTD